MLSMFISLECVSNSISGEKIYWTDDTELSGQQCTDKNLVSTPFSLDLGISQ